jgi:type IV pilus assembly protein PilM
MAGGSFVGLDIGSNQIKVAELRRSGNQLQVVAMGVAQTPLEAYDKSEIIDPQLLGTAVKNLLKQAGITSKEVVSSVSGQSAVVVRVIEVPQMSPSELAENMKWEVERHVPFATSEMVIDWTPIERPEGVAEGQNMEVLLAVAQQDMIDRHVEMLNAAGLKPKSIDVEPLAVCRTLLDIDPQQSQPGHTVTILNIGASYTEVGIYRDKLLSFPRTLPVAGDSLTRAIAQGLGIDLLTAEKYKVEYGEVIMDHMAGAPGAPSDFGGFSAPGYSDFTVPAGNPFGAPTDPFASPSSGGPMPFEFSTPGDVAPQPSGAPLEAAPGFGAPAPEFGAPAPEFGAAPAPENLPAPAGSGDPVRDALRIQVFSAMAPVLAELAQEVRRSLDYYRGRAGDAYVNEILLVGGTAKLKGLAKFLESELGIPTRVADVLHNVQVSAKSVSAQYAQDLAPVFPISVGLGLRDLVTDPNASKGKSKAKAKTKSAKKK